MVSCLWTLSIGRSKHANRTFALALSLTRHMYDHEEKKYNCDMCNYSSHFESELETHKIVHRKQPSHQ